MKLQTIVTLGFFMWRHIKPIFASHHTCDHLVGFLLPQTGMGKYNKIPQNFLFSSYHNARLQPSYKILAHTLLKFEILLQSKSKITACFVVFIDTGSYKRKPSGKEKSCVYCCALHHANPLFTIVIGQKLFMYMWIAFERVYKMTAKGRWYFKEWDTSAQLLKKNYLS